MGLAAAFGLAGFAAGLSPAAAGLAAAGLAAGFFSAAAAGLAAASGLALACLTAAGLAGFVGLSAREDVEAATVAAGLRTVGVDLEAGTGILDDLGRPAAVGLS